VSDATGSGNRVLDPIDRVSEILFGLIMVLTFTGSLSVAEVGRAEVRTMLFGALGCNLAWAVIDAVLYLMGSLADQGHGLATFRAVRREADPQKGQRIVAGALPSLVASVLQPAELESLRQRLKTLPDAPEHAQLSREDWLGAAGVFVLVFLSTFPVVIPFIFMKDIALSLRISNTVAIVMLFVAGHAFGRITGRHPVRAGIAMVVLGVVLVSVSIALGG
jgi:hypothetical protein